MNSGKLSGNVTSFRKKGGETLNIRGTRISTQNSQLLTSTGSSTLDFFIGGGLAVGTVCLIEEDRYNSYSSLLARIFLAEGVANGHSIFLSSGEQPSNTIIKALPAIRVPEVKSSQMLMDSTLDENMKIAWRYQHQSATFSSGIKLDSHNHGYDLSKTLPEEMLSNCCISTWDPSEESEGLQNEPYRNFITFPYSTLLAKISSKILSGGLQTSNKKCKKILRISVGSVGSPLWRENDHSDQELVRFLYLLRGLLRSSFAVVFITVPSYVVQNKVLRSRIHQMCDTVISLESFVGSDKKSNPLFKEFDGLLQIVKLPVLNTFMYPTLTSDLAFKLKKKDFLIERLHLPPDFEDSHAEASSSGCSGQPTKLDF